jgi:hypothetical protein
MAVIALTSVTGAPGVTTTALGLALAWHRPTLIVEADATPGSSILAGYCRGVLPHDQGLIDVALAAGLGEPLAEAIAGHVVDLPGGLRLLAGPATAAQVGSLGPLWEPLGAVLREMDTLGMDVIVDAGRLGAAHGPLELLRQADLVCALLRSDLPSINSTRASLGMLGDDLARGGLGEHTLRTVLVGPGRPYSPAEVAGVVEVARLAEVAWDPIAAGVLSHGAPPPRGYGRSALSRSLDALASAAVAALSDSPTVTQERG